MHRKLKISLSSSNHRNTANVFLDKSKRVSQTDRTLTRTPFYSGDCAVKMKQAEFKWASKRDPDSIVSAVNYKWWTILTQMYIRFAPWEYLKTNTAQADGKRINSRCLGDFMCFQDRWNRKLLLSQSLVKSGTFLHWWSPQARSDVVMKQSTDTPVVDYRFFF